MKIRDDLEYMNRMKRPGWMDEWIDGYKVKSEAEEERRRRELSR